MYSRVKIIKLLLLSVILVPAVASAGGVLFYKEVNLIGGYSDVNQWIGQSSMLSNSLGFEYYRKFSGEYGDYLTVDLQMRAAYAGEKKPKQAFGLEIHNAWLEYKLMPELKIRGGHFTPSFGMETVVDTHSTLVQTLMEEDVGFTKDWGAQVRGSFPRFDYEASLQIGSGMSLRRKDGSFLATARIGSPQGQNLQYGLSILYGDVLETEGMNTFPKSHLVSDGAVTKKRVGLDGQYLYGPYLFKTEVAYGRNDHDDVLGYLVEIDYTFPKKQNWELELQFRSWINDLGMHSSDNSTLIFGTSYKLNQDFTLRAVFSHDFNMMGHEEENKFIVQLYYYGA